ncbi:MAG TPA: ATP-binding protein [Thermoanaerobaculia bacterium]|nr:ATP-binding protein [Thermoanaerobaculia bacterium]
MPRSELERRLLVLGPRTRDASLIESVLSEVGVPALRAAGPDAFFRELERGAGALLVTEEALIDGASRLGEFLSQQPPWSDLPVLLLTAAGANSPTVLAAVESLGNVTLLERPTRVTSLVAAAKSALRARLRQYQTRAHLADREWAERRSAAELAVARLLARTTRADPTDEILRAVCEGLDWDAGGLWSVADADGVLRNAAFWSRTSRPVPRFEAATRSARMERGVGLPGRVLASGDPEWIRDVTRDANFPRRDAAAQDGLRGGMAFPIRRGGDTVAIMEFFSRDVEEPDAGLMATMSTIGAHVGQFLDRREAEESLRVADRRKDEFLATLAHELRNPLAPVRVAVQLLQAPTASEGDVLWAREVIDRQVRHFARLVEDLMEVSRVASGKIALRRERVELAQVVRSAVETSRPIIEASSHQFSVSLPPDPVTIDADPLRLSQILSNLLNNAAKFTPSGGRIRLSAQVDGLDLRISVSDTGIGIPPDMRDAIFEMFTQIDRSAEGGPVGLGIGLTLVRSFVQLHGGSVEARSEGPGRGSEFVVRLPVIVPEKTEDGPSVRAGAARGVSLRVVVVDDNEDSADGLAMLLRLEGHEVATAHDGLEAVSVTEAFRPDVVLLDIGLPGISGYEAARRIRALDGGKRIRLIALTGWGQQEDRRKSTEAGFDLHLVKPVEPADLEGALLGTDRAPSIP